MSGSTGHGRTNGTENRRMDGDDDPATDARAKARERLRQRRLNRGRAESRAGSAAPVGAQKPTVTGKHSAADVSAVLLPNRPPSQGTGVAAPSAQ